MRKSKPQTHVSVTAVCDPCRAKNYFGRVYNGREWKRTPKCDNCGGRMTEIGRTESVE